MKRTLRFALSVRPDTFRLLQKEIYDPHGRSPTNRSIAFRWFLWEEQLVHCLEREERKDRIVTAPHGIEPNGTERKRLYFRIPADYWTSSEEQRDQFLWELLEDLFSSDSTWQESRVEDQ